MGETVSGGAGCCGTLLLPGEERSGCAVAQNWVISRTEPAAMEALFLVKLQQLTDRTLDLSVQWMDVCFIQEEGRCRHGWVIE